MAPSLAFKRRVLKIIREQEAAEPPLPAIVTQPWDFRKERSDRGSSWMRRLEQIQREKRKPTCGHPTLRYAGDGLCCRCYNRRLYQRRPLAERLAISAKNSARQRALRRTRLGLSVDATEAELRDATEREARWRTPEWRKQKAAAIKRARAKDKMVNYGSVTPWRPAKNEYEGETE